MSRAALIERWNFNFNRIRRKENGNDRCSETRPYAVEFILNGRRDTSSNKISGTHAALRKKMSGYPVTVLHRRV